MSNASVQVETLRGRRGCMIWFLLLIVVATVVAGYLYGDTLLQTPSVQSVMESTRGIWNELFGVAPTPPDYEAVVRKFHTAEAALLLKTLDDEVYNAVVEQLPVYATGEALLQLQADAQALRDSNRFQRITLVNLEIVQSFFEYPTAKILTREQRQVETVERRDGDEVVVNAEEKVAQRVYQLVHSDQRWLVEKLVLVNP